MSNRIQITIRQKSKSNLLGLSLNCFLVHDYVVVVHAQRSNEWDVKLDCRFEYEIAEDCLSVLAKIHFGQIWPGLWRSHEAY